MTWLFVDDQFPEHPKVVAAGGDAAWLWLCAYGYVQRNLTEGYIPKVVVPRLSDRKKPEALAQRLVEVGLWEDKGDAYYMHDYHEFNASATETKAKRERRSAQAKAAAEARWRANGHADSNANSMPDACDQHCAEHAPEQCVRMHAAMLIACPACASARAPTPSPTPPPLPSPLRSRSSSSLTSEGASAEEEDALLEKAKALAKDALDAKRGRGETVDNPKAWLAKVTRQRLDELRAAQPDPEARRRSAEALGQNWAGVVDDLDELRELVGAQFGEQELRDVAMRAWHEARSA